MELSGLVEAIEQGDKAEANRFIEELTPRLNAFLRLHLNAEPHEAQDCVQDALLHAIEFIKEGKLKYTQSLFSFLLSSCRNNYYNIKTKNQKTIATEVPEDKPMGPKQLNELLSEERQRHLEQCLEQLSDTYRRFFEYWYRHPDSNAKAAATRFDMTESNVWTRKHRMIKKLSKCYQKKSEI